MSFCFNSKCKGQDPLHPPPRGRQRHFYGRPAHRVGTRERATKRLVLVHRRAPGCLCRRLHLLSSNADLPSLCRAEYSTSCVGANLGSCCHLERRRTISVASGRGARNVVKVGSLCRGTFSKPSEVLSDIRRGQEYAPRSTFLIAHGSTDFARACLTVGTQELWLPCIDRMSVFRYTSFEFHKFEGMPHG